jgi:predicted AAA+ superfamily ATPase
LADDDNSLSLFLTYGGLPHLSLLSLTDEIAFEYLRNVYSTILLKDVIARENIRNIAFLEVLVAYISENVGNLFSASNISKFLKSQRTDISTTLIISYLNALCNAFIINKAQRIDIKGLRRFEIGEKYYFEDLGIRNCIRGFDFGRDIHKLMENVVYQHLNSLGYIVYVGKLNGWEIDFVGLKEGKKVYVQVAYLLSNEETREREFGNLLKIKDNFPKYVVTMDSLNRGSNFEGIIHLHLREFLKTEKFLS